VGDCFFWYRPTLVVPDQRPLNGCVRVRVRACACVRAAGYQPRPQVVDRGMTTRYGGQLQLRYKRVSSPDEQAAANHAATESPERGGGLAGGTAYCRQVSAHALR